MPLGRTDQKNVKAFMEYYNNIIECKGPRLIFLLFLTIFFQQAIVLRKDKTTNPKMKNPTLNKCINFASLLYAQQIFFCFVYF